MVFYAAFNSISVISWRQLTFFYAFLGFTSTRLGSEVSCPRTLPRKKPRDLVRLEPRTPGLRVKHLTTKPHGTLIKSYSALNTYQTCIVTNSKNWLPVFRFPVKIRFHELFVEFIHHA